jgi:hypothetical protein
MERFRFIVGSQLGNLCIEAGDTLLPVPRHPVVIPRPIDEPTGIIARGEAQVVS